MSWLPWCCATLVCCAPGLPAIDVQSPHVVSVDPSDGAVDVPLDVVINVCFDRAMQPETLDASTVSLSRVVGTHGFTIPLAIVASGDVTCFGMTPQGLLSPQSGYTLAVAKGALSAAGVELSHGSGQLHAFQGSFHTRGAGALATLLVPAEGTVHAPTDLGSIQIAFSLPVTTTASAFDAEPGSLRGTLSSDGLGADVALSAAGAPGQSVTVTLDPNLRDLSGNLPGTSAPLGFSFGDCAEGAPPSLGAGLALGRDRDAVLLFEVDRPSICSAAVIDPDCPDAGSIFAAASCGAAYDPCTLGASCECLVPLVGLCPGDSLSVQPTATGWNGQSAQADPVPLTLSPPLPALALGELMLKPAANKKAGIYLEVQNLAAEPQDLQGLVLADCTGTVSCFAPAHQQAFGALATGGVTVLGGYAYALLVDGTFDSTLYPDLPPGTLLLAPSDLGPLMHLATNRPQPLGLIDAASGGLLSSFDGSILPIEGLSIERIDPYAADPIARNWGFGSAPGGTPGTCNSVTVESQCVEGRLDGGAP